VVTGNLPSRHWEERSEMAALITLLASAASETGLVRQNNEDAVYSGRWLFAVADGLGGHAAGEFASAAVIDALSFYDAEADPASLLEVLGQAVAEANREVARRESEDPARLGMGTTLTAMLCSGDQAGLVHIGDSRAFRLRNGQLRQITEDHVMGKLVSNAGDLAPVLTRYLDGRPDRSPDLSRREMRPGDRYLLCSDGLSPIVTAAAICDVLVAYADTGEAARQLVTLAEEAGGPDNISVIVIDVREGAAAAHPAEPVILGAAAAEALAR
jgi:PPM family protein phosphatase